jgi:hypothetical protein
MKPQPTPQPEPTKTYIFDARELARLAVYRAAIVAGFYTDQCEASPSPISPVVAHLVATR